MIDERDNIVDQAIAWHMRQADMSEIHWREFILWLEADPAHARVFDRIALDQNLVAARPELAGAMVPPAPANDDGDPVRRSRWLWAVGGTAIAASLVALLTPLALPRASSPYLFETASGQRRNLTLADGTRIEVSGGTRLRLDHANPRVASLEAGEATFHVTHDDRDPFTLRSGDLTVRDLGTVFNVAREGSRLDLQVAEGSVLFQPGREAVRVTPGLALSAREDLRSVALSHIAVDAVGGWRTGRLSFTNETLSSVTAAIKRLYGIDVRLDPDLSARPFTGMVRLTGVAERDIPHIAALVGAGWRRNGERWTLSPFKGDTR
jgi:transmembrane sensor